MIDYPRYEKLIHHTVHKFRRKYKVADLEQLQSIANLAFVEAHQTFDANQGQLSTWIVRCVWRALYVETRREWTRKQRHRTIVTDLAQRPDNEHDWLDSLTEDGQMIIRMILYIPLDVKILMRGGTLTATKIVSAVKKTLRSIGWNHQRISETLTQIEGAYNGQE